ncbi:hypothetical protein C8Q73DRAFT_246399 [Cubamyces lactineus]|nr:hypothetical protein C8Q73DRAFT_246399 [Cubamyces lactineus]
MSRMPISSLVSFTSDTISMAEMLAMLHEFQKRKASKTSARSITFQNQKNALSTNARQTAEKAIRNGAAAIEQARVTILDFKAQEVSQEATLVSLKALLESQDDCVQAVLDNLNGVIEDLSHRRAKQIDDASAMLEAQALARERSRKRLVEHARARIEENLEHQKTVTDASNLIKHYKALLRC